MVDVPFFIIFHVIYQMVTVPYSAHNFFGKLLWLNISPKLKLPRPSGNSTATKLRLNFPPKLKDSSPSGRWTRCKFWLKCQPKVKKRRLPGKVVRSKPQNWRFPRGCSKWRQTKPAPTTCQTATFRPKIFDWSRNPRSRFPKSREAQPLPSSDRTSFRRSKTLSSADGPLPTSHWSGIQRSNAPETQAAWHSSGFGWNIRQRSNCEGSLENPPGNRGNWLEKKVYSCLLPCGTTQTALVLRHSKGKMLSQSFAQTTCWKKAHNQMLKALRHFI